MAKLVPICRYIIVDIFFFFGNNFQCHFLRPNSCWYVFHTLWLTNSVARTHHEYWSWCRAYQKKKTYRPDCILTLSHFDGGICVWAAGRGRMNKRRQQPHVCVWCKNLIKTFTRIMITWAWSVIIVRICCCCYSLFWQNIKMRPVGYFDFVKWISTQTSLT